ncbi:MAG: dicarboxylate/amino acid:cation symporter [Gammaproteobacteria bacterium]|nr:dicarboxylate/amino acid:cation symporter [Gammaproteobacteria bacterium]
MPKLALHWQILLAIGLAALAGGFGGELRIGDLPLRELYGFVGTGFMNALKLLVVPLIMSSLIGAVAQLDSGATFGRLGLKTLAYYFGTGLAAILMGLFWVNTLAPGRVAADSPLREYAQKLDPDLAQRLQGHDLGDFAQVFLQIFPPNIVQAAAEGQILGLIAFSLLFGFFVGRLEPELKETLLRFWAGVSQIMLRMTGLVLRFAPLGVFALVAKTVAETGFAAIQPLAWFFLTVALSLVLHAGLTMSLVLRLVARVSPLRTLRAFVPALLMAFSTASSSATLPMTLDCVFHRARVSEGVGGFVLPLGANVNMDGSGLYECVAAMFIAQLYGLDLSFGAQFLIVATALFTSMGVAGIPAASLVAITVILSAIGLPMEAIGVLMVTDRLLDMMRTAVNVYGDMCGSVVVARSEGEATDLR